MSRYDKFRPTCPRCADRLSVGAMRCESCGAKTGLVKLPPIIRLRRLQPPPEPRPTELPPPCTSTRYIVREVEGYRITLPIRLLAYNAKPGIECVVLDTAWNHRQVAAFSAEQFRGNRSRRQMFAAAREAAATRCDLLNRLDEIATREREAVSAHSERTA